MIKKLRQAYFYCVLEKPSQTLLLLLLTVILFCLNLNQLRLDASADALTLEYDHDLDYFRKIYQRYQSGDFLVITYTSKTDLFTDKTLHHIRSLRDELLEVEGVSGANSILDVPLLYSPPVSLTDVAKGPNTLFSEGVDRELAKKEFLESPIYRDMLLGPDGKTTAILLNLAVDNRFIELVRERDALRLKHDQKGLSASENLRLDEVSHKFLEYSTKAAERSHRRVAEVRKVIDRYRDKADIFLGGVSMITADMINFISSDLVVFGSGIIIFIVIILSVIFRHWQFVLLPLATCLSSVLIMLGFLSTIDWRMTVISSNFVALLLIVCLAVTIHLIVRYREYLATEPAWTNKQAIRATVSTMSKPCLYTVMTTMVAFASLVISGIRPVVDFGLMMSLGLCVVFILAFLVIPSGLLLLPNVSHHKLNVKKDDSGTFTLRFSRLTTNYGKTILAASAVAAIISYLGIRQLDVENRFIDYFRESTEIYQGMRVIDQQLGGTVTLDIVLDHHRKETEDPQTNQDPFGESRAFDEIDPFASATPFSEHQNAEAVEENYWFTQAGLNRVQQIHDYLEQLPEVGKVQSLATAYKVASELNGKSLNNFELAVMRASLPETIKSFLITPYLSKNEDVEQTRITMRVKETDPNLRRAQLIDKVRNYAIDEVGLAPEQVNITGMLVLYNNMLQSLFQSQILTIGAVFVGIMIMFLILFRSLLLSLIAIIPNMLAAAIVLGGMGLTGIPLDMMTITIASIAVGIGVDNAIHYIYRFRREFAIDNDYIAAMHRSHGSIGRAMYYTSITIIAGFSILALSNFIPSVYFGLLTGLAMLAAILGSLTLLPKLILLLKPLT